MSDGTRMPVVVLAIVGAIAAALLLGAGSMDPAGADRQALALSFAGVGVLTVLAALAIPRFTRRLGSVRLSVMVTVVAALATVAIAVTAASVTGFLDTDQLRLVLVATGLGTAMGVVLAVAMTAPLERDLDRVRDATDAVAHGDLEVTTGVSRRDEIGDLASDVDMMVERLRASAAEQERIEGARRDFFAAIGHDLRTPLTSLRSAIEALQDGMAADPARFLRAMHADVDLLSGLVDDLFLLARIESGGLELALERLDLREVADEVAETFAPVAREKGVTVTLDADGAVWVLGASRELGRVLRNLVANAVRHAPPSSRVDVVVRRGPTDAVVVVRDEGEGFAPDFVERAFASFVRADAARQRDTGGAGLGLAIARGLVDAHGGVVAASPGPGGRVTVRLPLATAASPFG